MSRAGSRGGDSAGRVDRGGSRTRAGSGSRARGRGRDRDRVARLAGAGRVVDVEAVGPLPDLGLVDEGDLEAVDLGRAESAVYLPGVLVGSNISDG